MREFKSLGAFAGHLLTLQATEMLALHEGLKRCAVHVEESAKEAIGEYQAAAGPFGAWPALAEATEAEKARLAYPADAPLLRTGDLRDSITHEVSGLEAVIGSPSDIALYQELGTATIPPRPFLGPALVHNSERIKRALEAATVAGLVGGRAMLPGLGYDGEV